MTAVIELEHLTKSYGASRGIEDVSMAVQGGEVFGFLGPNGAGKTTTIRTVLDLLHPTSGAARVFGLDSRRDREAIHARLGNLPGDFAYDPRVTGRELLTFLADLRGVAGLGRADELAQRFQADLDRPLGQLSRGNRQKIGLVQAAFHDPELLVLDEPTSGLDPLMQEAFLDFVGDERDRGRTVFLSSHDLDEVERACDRVGIIRAGRLAAVEHVADITGRAYRHVTLEFASAIDPDEFRRLGGVTDLDASGRTISFKATGDLDPIIKAAARHTVTDIELARPTLEEVFLTYYGSLQ
ncbi:ABC transporter ATP-binding protein [Solirubrobacter soli]|uniref:ABC transporter ATP-binding protein n=1 Tax=Solirubrobacter soli TaxID=363832 RepID=UPI0004064638|nr:ABC transporter ATP-binding protein [Solirubrobacter soli]